MMDIFEDPIFVIMNNDGNIIRVEVNKTYTFKKLQTRIQNDCGIPLKQQCFTCEDERNYSDMDKEGDRDTTNMVTTSESNDVTDATSLIDVQMNDSGCHGMINGAVQEGTSCTIFVAYTYITITGIHGKASAIFVKENETIEAVMYRILEQSGLSLEQFTCFDKRTLEENFWEEDYKRFVAAIKCEDLLEKAVAEQNEQINALEMNQKEASEFAQMKNEYDLKIKKLLDDSKKSNEKYEEMKHEKDNALKKIEDKLYEYKLLVAEKVEIIEQSKNEMDAKILEYETLLEKTIAEHKEQEKIQKEAHELQLAEMKNEYDLKIKEVLDDLKKANEKVEDQTGNRSGDDAIQPLTEENATINRRKRKSLDSTQTCILGDVSVNDKIDYKRLNGKTTEIAQKLAALPKFSNLRYVYLWNVQEGFDLEAFGEFIRKNPTIVNCELNFSKVSIEFSQKMERIKENLPTLPSTCRLLFKKKKDTI
uniref:Ubiquitin-like domain-containing protein n=1 Tax=Panagrolaimus davidi TaxID=227884 RepID=A0A914PEK7_9BILA